MLIRDLSRRTGSCWGKGKARKELLKGQCLMHCLQDNLASHAAILHPSTPRMRELEESHLEH